MEEFFEKATDNKKSIIFGQISNAKTPEAKQAREESNKQERERREEEGVDWFLLNSVAPLIKKYLKTRSEDDYGCDIIKDGSCVLYQDKAKTKDDFLKILPKDLMDAVEEKILDIFWDGDNYGKIVLSKKTRKNYENYKKFEGSWGKEKEQSVE